MAFLVNLVASYLFENAKTLRNHTTYHGIYHAGGLVVFKGNKRVQYIRDCLAKFQQTLEKAAGKQHLHFTAKIWTNDTNLPTSTKKDKVQITTNCEFHILFMKIIWSPEGYL